ncbi:TylF/MycF/NovP-related O-methyltransferase [Roseococcus suduntuyensis]|uniref:Macrocin O-methyltransferase n=1 Tax=Roseococcus suduntuyensis TaxID=455361 RepID=A0A840AGT4_9PROT|nr:TylF/MycF/NovP-related O-methyltransferase [Roseococcus suduntuyensis]MBB3900227.1 hypothetical protein [Roseococcus suduntuyensis]
MFQDAMQQSGRAPLTLEEAARRFRHLGEETGALRVSLQATERERQAALERANVQATLGRDLRQEMDGLRSSLTSEIHDARDKLAWAMKTVEAQVLASRASLDGLVRSIAQPQGSIGGQAATLYLDLLELSLTGVLSDDVSIDPWTAGTYDPGRRAIGRDWPATACTMIGTARMRNLRHLLERALAEDVPGDFIETGVWRGGACIYARGILAAHGDATRRVFVADSFRGLPEPDAEAFPADVGDQHSTYQQLAINQEQVAENFRRYGLLDERVVFLEGWFKDTLPTAPIERLAVLRLDGDMYESTIQALDALYDKVSPGGYVIVDDYILGPCARAIEDFRAARGITASLEPVDGAAVWWQVPR